MNTTSTKGLNRGVAPVTYGTGDRPPRGDYGRARSDYTCEQNHARYTAADHDTYRRLHARQLQQLPGLACDAFIAAVQHLGPPEQIPRFDAVSEKLMRATGWQLVAVPGLIPEEAFFALLAERRFPVTDWIRKPEELDYVVEPDVFHDLFGHVPLLFVPAFADYMQAYGAGGLKASRQMCIRDRADGLADGQVATRDHAEGVVDGVAAGRGGGQTAAAQGSALDAEDEGAGVARVVAGIDRGAGQRLRRAGRAGQRAASGQRCDDLEQGGRRHRDGLVASARLPRVLDIAGHDLAVADQRGHLDRVDDQHGPGGRAGNQGQQAEDADLPARTHWP